MDATAQGRAMQLLGQFNDDMTRVFDDVFGTQWAEIEDILVIAAVASNPVATTRRLADLTRLNRRAMSRMVARLHGEGLVDTRPSDADKRAMQVVFTARGRQQAAVLRTSIAAFFAASSTIAGEICAGLGPVRHPRASAIPADPMDLLQRMCEAGVSLVRVMPEAATRGKLAARQRAALVQIATQRLVRPNDLSPTLGVSRAGVAYILDQLCAKGFVTRLRGTVPDDRRAVVLEATAEGMQAVRAVMDGIAQQGESLSRLFAEVAHWRPPGDVAPERIPSPDHTYP